MMSQDNSILCALDIKEMGPQWIQPLQRYEKYKLCKK